jgi:hypothetical protein
MADSRFAAVSAFCVIFIAFALLFGCSEAGSGDPGEKPSTPPASRPSTPPAEDPADAPPTDLEIRIDKALKLNARMGCTMCHALDGPKKISESYSVLFGTEVELEDGSKVIRDENYLRLSILDPNAQIPKGATPAMPSYEGRLSLDEVDLLVDLIKHLKENAAPAP